MNVTAFELMRTDKETIRKLFIADASGYVFIFSLNATHKYDILLIDDIDIFDLISQKNLFILKNTNYLSLKTVFIE